MDPGFLFFIAVALILLLIIFWRFFKSHYKKDWLFFERKIQNGFKTNSCIYAVHRVLGFTTGCYHNMRDLFEEIDDNHMYGPID